MENPVRIRRQMVIMRNHNQRLVLFPDDPLHQFQHIHRRVRIQISSRLVCKNDLWMYHQRPCDADTLLLPASMFSGAIFLLLADLIARTLLSPVELSIGVVTSLVGAAAFVVIFYRARKAG